MDDNRVRSLEYEVKRLRNGSGGTLNSGTAADGTVLTSDGASGSAWEAIPVQVVEGTAVKSTGAAAAKVLTANGSAASTWEVIPTPPAQVYPKRAVMWHDLALVTTGNAIARALDNAQLYNVVCYQNAAANGDVFTHGCLLAAGTYTFSVLGFTGTDRGKIDWTLDGVSIAAGQDWYAASGARNVVKTATGVVVAAGGWHTLTGTINGKTGAPGGYYMQLTRYAFIPAAD